jgi:hypothetical protein
VTYQTSGVTPDDAQLLFYWNRYTLDQIGDAAPNSYAGRWWNVPVEEGTDERVFDQAKFEGRGRSSALCAVIADLNGTAEGDTESCVDLP